VSDPVRSDQPATGFRHLAAAAPGKSAGAAAHHLGATIAYLALRMSLRPLLVLVLPAVTACVGNIQRSARVPHPGVPLSSGQPLATPAELAAGLSNVTDVMKPRVGDATQAVEVPSTEMRDELRFRIGKRGQIGAIYEQGFASTSRRPDATQAPVGDGDVQGYGISGGYSFETSTPGLSIGSTLEVMAWSVPFVEYETCTNCSSPWTIMNHGRANPMTLGVGVTPSYRSGAITLFGGAFARNHPTTLRKELNTDIAFNDNDGDVQSGPFNLLLHAGVEIEIERWLSALVVVHQDIDASPVRYGPGVGVALTARLGN
jgi:hypothetical protein